MFFRRGLAKIRALFLRRRPEDDLAEEIRSHLAMEEQENVESGMAPEEAHYAALRRFGNVTLAQERSREMWRWTSLETLWQDLRYGLRVLRRNPAFTAVAVVTLALGIGANVAIFSVVDEVLLRSMPYRDSSRLVMIWETYLKFPKVWPSVPNFRDWQAQCPSFEAIGAYRVSRGFTLTGHGEPERHQGTYASANLFELLGVEPAAGRTFLYSEDKLGSEPVMILSHALWQRVFAADAHAIGKTVALDDKTYTVVGVMPANFQFPAWADFWLPFGQLGQDEMTNRIRHPLEVVARLKPGTTRAEAQSELHTIAARLGQQYSKTNGGWGVIVMPLRAELVGGVQPALLILLGATGLVLLIACANVANLMLARASAREKEMAVRAAHGAARARLMRQLLTESLALSTLGGGLGLLLARWGQPLLLGIDPSIVPHAQNTSLHGLVLAFALAVSILTGIVFGMIPAFQISRVELGESLKQGARTAGGSRSQCRFRSSFVAVQSALALILLAGAGLLIKSFVHVLGIDPGFNPHNVLTARIDLPASRSHSDGARFYAQVSERLQTLPGVESVGLINALPLGSDANIKSRFLAEGVAASDHGYPVAEVRIATPGYFRALGVPLLSGRFFKPKGEEQSTFIIVGATLARRYFAGVDPVGRRINASPLFPKPTWCTIVGVVGDVRDFGLASDSQNAIYFDDVDSGLSLVVRTRSDPMSLALSVRRVVEELDREATVRDVRTGEELISHSLAARRFTMIVLGLFAGIAVALAVVGTYGVVSYSVAQRTQEIGVRLALGAKPFEVLKMIVGQGMSLTLVGVALGLMGALATGPLLGGLLYGVKSSDPQTLAAVALLLVIVSFVASYLPARRATRIDPMVALRYE